MCLEKNYDIFKIWQGDFYGGKKTSFLDISACGEHHFQFLFQKESTEILKISWAVPLTVLVLQARETQSFVFTLTDKDSGITR